MATTPTPPRFVGARMRRAEDPRFLTGRGSYVDDLAQAGLVEAAFVRSPYAHARIVRIDASAARALPGVLLVLTGDEAAREFPTLKTRGDEALKPIAVNPLAVGKVCFVGDPVALVVATDRYKAEDAAELVEVEYAPLPVVTDPEEASRPGAPAIDEAGGTNVVYHATKSFGDVAAAFRDADRIVRERFYSNRQTNLPMETRGCIMAYNPASGELIATVGTQAPHLERGWLAKGLGIEENRIRVIAPDIGGAFGQKFGLYRDEWAVAVAAMKLGRPVKWIEDRRENLLASNHAREDIADVEAAVKADGTILGLRVKLLGDVGAYTLYPAPPNDIPAMTAYTSTGPYKIPAFEYEVTAVLTNKCTQASYRAPWALSTWIHEGIVDRIARQLRLDPVDVRRRNLIRDEDQPYTMPNETGWEIDAVSLVASTEKALELLDYATFREEQRRLRQQGRYRGVGICTYAEPTGFGFDVALVRVDPTGTVTAVIGISAHGQGYETTMAQVVADELSVDIRKVRIVQNDTAAVPFGQGTGGSRGAVVGAGSLMLAAREVKQKALTIAAHLLEARPEDLEISDGVISVKGVPGRSVSLGDVADKAYNDLDSLPPGVTPLLESTNSYKAPPTTFSNSTHVCVVDVDPDTGVVTIPRYLVVNDCGVMINPMIVEGQIRGGTAQGIAGALYEELVYDESGQLVNSTLMDYLVPTPAEIPPIEIAHLVTPTPHTLGGVKGVGEGGTLGAPPAVANALYDALAPFDANPTRMPFTPERVLEMIRGGPGGGRGTPARCARGPRDPAARRAIRSRPPGLGWRPGTPRNVATRPARQQLQMPRATSSAKSSRPSKEKPASGSNFSVRGGQPVAVRQRAGGQVVERLVPAEEPAELVDHDLEEPAAALPRLTGDVRREEHVGKLANPAIGGDRLRVPDVERPGDVAPGEALDRRVGVDDRPARDVHQGGTRADQVELAFPDHPARLRGDRRDADDHVRLGHERVEVGEDHAEHVGHLLRDVGVVRPDRAVERREELDQPAPDDAQPDEPDLLPRQLEAREIAPLPRPARPAAGDELAIGGAGVARRVEHHPQGPLRDAVRRAIRRVGYPNAAGLRRFDVDPGREPVPLELPDNPKAGRGVEDRVGDPRAAVAHDQPGDVSDVGGDPLGGLRIVRDGGPVGAIEGDGGLDPGKVGELPQPRQICLADHPLPDAAIGDEQDLRPILSHRVGPFVWLTALRLPHTLPDDGRRIVGYQMDVLGGKAKGGLIPLIRPTPGSSIRVGPTPAGRGALARLLLVVATVLCLLASADIGSTAQAPQSGPIRESVLIDQGVLDLELEPGVGSPPVDQQRALTLAASHVSGASQATSVQARYVALTLRDASGNVRRGLEAQPAWIVTFGGVAYAPSGSSASVCSCAVVYQRPNTAVALDARTGALIALFGAEN